MPPARELTRRFLRQSPERQGLLMEALLYLIWARVLLLLCPFRYLRHLLERPVGRNSPITGEARRLATRRIRWAVERTAEQLPGQTACFPRGIAAHLMCRKRGISTTLIYGGATAEGLVTHVWVVDGEVGVIGHQIAHQYRMLGSFPA